MSIKTNFHTTEELLIAREKLHELIDYFWQVLPNTRTEVYQKVGQILNTTDTHVSDMSISKIKRVAKAFQTELESLAPCSSCKYRKKTKYGVVRCLHEKMNGAFWLNRSQDRCKHYVPIHLPAKRSVQPGS